MKTFIVLCSILLVGYGFVQAPLPALWVALGTTLIICWWFYYLTGPLVKAAENVAKIYVDRDALPGELVFALQEMSRIAFKRRKL